MKLWQRIASAALVVAGVAAFVVLSPALPAWLLVACMGAASFFVAYLRRPAKPAALQIEIRTLRKRILETRLARMLGAPRTPRGRRSMFWDDEFDDDDVEVDECSIDVPLLETQIGRYATWKPHYQVQLLGWVQEYVQWCGRNKRFVCDTWQSNIARIALPVLLGITKPENFSSVRRMPDDAIRSRSLLFANSVENYDPEQFEPFRATIEEMWGGRVIIERAPDFGPGVVRIRTMPVLPKTIAFTPSPIAVEIIFGTDLLTGEVVALDVRKLPHLLIMGTSGFGKSMFLHQLITQLVCTPPDAVDRVILVDLKGGVEFKVYEQVDGRVTAVWRFDDVVTAVGDLVTLMEKRQDEMLEQRKRTYSGGKVFFIVDEFAQIQLYPVEGKEGRQTHERLLANLNRLSMLGRAAGIVICAAIQKATTDVMDSSFRTNLQGQVCFRVPNRLAAASMFGSIDELKFDPVALARGQFIFYDPTIGETRYLQAHVVTDT